MRENARWGWEQGSQVVREWQRSGLSLTEFARRRGIGAHRLRYWHERIERSAQSADEVDGAGATQFVPGVVVGLGSSQLRVHLPHGVIVEATTAEEVAPEWLAAVVIALGRV